MTHYNQSNDDAVYEQDIIRDPGSTKPWLAYIQFKMQHGTLHEQAFVLERACLQLPRSYKLWKMVSSNLCLVFLFPFELWQLVPETD